MWDQNRYKDPHMHADKAKLSEHCTHAASPACCVLNAHESVELSIKLTDMRPVTAQLGGDTA